MMLGDPKAMIAKFFGPNGQPRRCAKRIGGTEPLFNRTFVEKTKEIRHAVSSMFSLDVDHGAL
jgi:hypothetical protein